MYEQVLSKMLEALSTSTESSTPNVNRWMSSGAFGQIEDGEGYDDDEEDEEDEDEESLETCSVGTMEDATANAFNVRIKVLLPL